MGGRGEKTGEEGESRGLALLDDHADENDCDMEG
jgi:hypothetical protein